MPHCDGCGEKFASRNAIFRHLKETNAACLDPKACKEFQRYVLLQDRKKVMILYGYVVLPEGREFAQECWSNCLENGQDAAAKLLHVLEEECPPEGDTYEPPKAPPKLNRSYGNTGRNAACLQQDDQTGAVTEVLATRLPAMTMPLDDWVAHVNKLLESKNYPLRVFGRIDMPFSKFNAEMDVTHRRIEYLLPADFLMPNDKNSNNQHSLEELFATLPGFLGVDQNYGSALEALNKETTSPNDDTKTYLCQLKNIMQSLATKVVVIEGEGAVLEKEFHKQKRKQQCFKSGKRRNHEEKSNVGNAVGEKEVEAHEKVQNKNNQSPTSRDDEKGGKAKGKRNNRGTRVLRRRRFHNFTHSMMAHDFFSFRRMDRVYHRATLRFPERLYKQVEAQSTGGSNALDRNRAFLAVSISGDLFLQGQICRVVGVLIALASGRIDKDFVDCVFDEDYPHLVPTPQAPPFAMYAVEANYTQWEGKVKKILTARQSSNSYQEGWHTPATLQKVNEWQAITREEIAKVWLSQGVDSKGGRLWAEREWTRDVLEPWLAEAKQRLEHYRHWKNSKEMEVSEFDNLPNTLPPLSSIDQSVPALYQKVLQCLREADKSGLWPSTTPKRQMVMVSTPADGGQGDQGNKNPTLSMAHFTARNKKNLERSSAYAFQEGEGGASGSFSVGVMPGETCAQPKGNQMFPQLMKAAFELEIALRPDRTPSSTIAINRNAQFRPHTDSGAGAGQSTSLIVALGNFVGGELVVEGKQEDIRYRALEFNGWTQRHWTMPLQGERYSLVWFTPKGCEGVCGIDLCH